MAYYIVIKDLMKDNIQSKLSRKQLVEKLGTTHIIKVEKQLERLFVEENKDIKIIK